MVSDRPIMHCHSELKSDLGYGGFLPDKTLFKWFHDRYSTSKHLLTLYSIAVGIGAKTIVEIGFGRSSFVLAKAASENEGRFITCDNRDFSYLLSKEEKNITEFIHGNSSEVWNKLKDDGIDFAFLDHLSSESWSKEFVQSELNTCVSLLKKNGILCVHDTIVEKYQLKGVFNKMDKRLLGYSTKNLELISLPFNYGLGIIRKLADSKFGSLEDSFVKKEDQ